MNSGKAVEGDARHRGTERSPH